MANDPCGKAKRAKQAAEVFELRLQGKTMAVIAAELGISRPTVYRRMSAALHDVLDPRVSDYRKIYDARYERMLASLAPKIEMGDVEAINTACRIIAQASKLHGIDAPSRSEQTIEVVTPQDVEIREMIAQQQAMNARTAAVLDTRS